jgi:hypothetical protein
MHEELDAETKYFTAYVGVHACTAPCYGGVDSGYKNGFTDLFQLFLDCYGSDMRIGWGRGQRSTHVRCFSYYSFFFLGWGETVPTWHAGH